MDSNQIVELRSAINILVYSHHRSGGGTPLDTLWYSAEECAAHGVRLRFAWTASHRIGLSALLRHRRVIFDGINSLRMFHGPIIWHLARLLNKKRAIYWHETDYIIEQARKSAIVRSAMNDPRAAHFHVCRVGAQSLSCRYGVASDRIRILENIGVIPEWQRYDLPLPVTPGLFVTAGVLQEHKEPETFVEIAQHVLVRRPDARFVWCGRGGFGSHSLNALRREVLRRGLGGKVIFTGYVENAWTLMSMSEAVVLTSRSEGAPKILIEALALGKKAVAFGVGGVSEILEGCGRVIEYRDTQTFCDALCDTRDVVNDRLPQMRRERYVERYTPTAFSARFLEGLRWWDALS